MELKKFAIEENWEGNGSINNPYICLNADIFPEECSLTGIGYHILFRDCVFKEFDVKRSQNMIFEECKFSLLSLSYCSNLRITNCDIYILNLTGASSNNFSHCSFEKVNNFASHSNRFLKCVLDPSSKNALLSEFFDFSKVTRYFPILIIIFISIIGVSIFVMQSTNILLLVGEILVTVVLLSFWLLTRNSGLKNPNEIIE